VDYIICEKEIFDGEHSSVMVDHGEYAEIVEIDANSAKLFVSEFVKVNDYGIMVFCSEEIEPVRVDLGCDVSE